MKKLIIGLIILGVQLSANLVLADTYCQFQGKNGSHLIKLIDNKYYFNDIEIKKDVLIDDIEFTFDNERNLSFKTVKGNLTEGTLFINGGGFVNGRGALISSFPPISLSKKVYEQKFEDNSINTINNTNNEEEYSKKSEKFIDDNGNNAPKKQKTTNYKQKTHPNTNTENIIKQTCILKINDKTHKVVKIGYTWFGGEGLDQEITTEKIIIDGFEFSATTFGGELYFESLEISKNGAKLHGYMSGTNAISKSGHVTMIGKTSIFHDEVLPFDEIFSYRD